PTPTFTFSAGEPGATFACRAGPTLAPGPFAPCASPWTTAPLAGGAAAFAVQATDAAGNAGPAVSRTFTVDATAPAVSITGGPDGATSSPSPTFAFSSSDAGASFACRAGATPL